MNQNELNTMLGQAWNASDLVRAGLMQSYFYNQALFNEQKFLLEWNAHYTATHDVDVETLQHATLARIDHDLKVTWELNHSMTLMQAQDDVDMTFSLRNNKMNEALLGARELIADETTFITLLQGDFPEGFENSPSFPVLIGDPTASYGNSNATFLTTALVEMSTTFSGNQASIQDLPLDLDQSALAHLVSVPEGLLSSNPDLYDAYRDTYTFRFSDETTPLGFVFIHSGYAFGGHRDEARYMEGKLFGPEDCSSWISKLTGCDYEYSTIDQLYAYRTLMEGNQEYVDPQWLNTECAQNILECYTPVTIHEPMQDIQPGQIMVMRKFDSMDHADSSGYSGHTGLVLGVTESEQVLVLNYSRAMPEKEGFGLQLFDWHCDETKEILFLEATQPPLSISDVFQVENTLLNDVGSTITNRFGTEPLLEFHNADPLSGLFESHNVFSSI